MVSSKLHWTVIIFRTRIFELGVQWNICDWLILRGEELSTAPLVRFSHYNLKVNGNALKCIWFHYFHNKKLSSYCVFLLLWYFHSVCSLKNLISDTIPLKTLMRNISRVCSLPLIAWPWKYPNFTLGCQPWPLAICNSRMCYYSSWQIACTRFQQLLSAVIWKIPGFELANPVKYTWLIKIVSNISIHISRRNAKQTDIRWNKTKRSSKLQRNFELKSRQILFI